MNISNVLSRRKEERGISYAELARRTFINEDMVSRFMNGTSMPKGDQFLRLCKELDLDFSDFYDTEVSSF